MKIARPIASKKQKIFTKKTSGRGWGGGGGGGLKEFNLIGI